MAEQGQGFIVSGCGEERFNGVYKPDPGAKQGEGCSRPFRQERGPGTIEYWSQAGYPVWHLSERYGADNDGATYYYCESTSTTPPLFGWEVGGGQEPAPSLSPNTNRRRSLTLTHRQSGMHQREARGAARTAQRADSELGRLRQQLQEEQVARQLAETRLCDAQAVAEQARAVSEQTQQAQRRVQQLKQRLADERKARHAAEAALRVAEGRAAALEEQLLGRRTLANSPPRFKEILSPPPQDEVVAEVRRLIHAHATRQDAKEGPRGAHGRTYL